MESHERMFAIFNTKGTYLEMLILRRLLLTKIQDSLKSNSVSRKAILKYSVEYLRILFTFYIKVDIFIIGLALFSIVNHRIAQQLYLKFV